MIRDRDDDGSEAWYRAEGQRAEQLLTQGHVAEATELFEAILTRLGDAPSYGRAVILGRLGRCFQASDRPDMAVGRIREAIDVVGRLAPSDGLKRLRGTLRSDLGEVFRAGGQYSEAKKAYEAALSIARELNDLSGQGVELARLGALALAEGKLEEALARQEAALRLFQQLHQPEMVAAAWHQLGRVYHQQGRWDEADRHYRESAQVSEARGRVAAAVHTWNQLAVCARDAGNPQAAEAWYRKALEVNRRVDSPAQLGRRLHNLADLLRNEPGRLGDARQLAEESLAVAQALDPTALETWSRYGILADIIDKEAAGADGELRVALELQARDYRELQQRAPAISAALAQLNPAASFGRAVLLRQLGRCFHTGKRPDLAVACHREAIRLTATLAPATAAQGLHGALHLDLGDMLRATGQEAAAQDAYLAALTVANESQDLRGQAVAAQRLGLVVQEQPRRSKNAGFDVIVHTELTTDYIFGTDLLIDGPRERRISRWTADTDPLSDGVRPMLLPRARTWMDDDGAIRFNLPRGEPIVVRHSGFTLMRRIGHEVAVPGRAAVLWRLIARMDGMSTVAEIVSGFPSDERPLVVRMLAALAATGAIDVSGRAVGRFLHVATQKGVLPAGGLEGEAVLHLATDGHYREYPDARRIAVGQAVPDRLRTFHALTRARRSSRDYRGLALRRDEFDALLHTACGITGSMPWAGREVKLRAYPSSGALYAVEIYPVVFRVEDLAPAVYHYRAVENLLETVKSNIDPAGIVDAALPVERAMLASASTLFCLTGCFARHERKYGEGGYRMLVAEAGHISQNLILAATALGLGARPFGGVFDGVLNHQLGLDAAEEQFLLAVIVGVEEV